MSLEIEKKKYTPLSERRVLNSLKLAQRMQIRIRNRSTMPWYAVLGVIVLTSVLFLISANMEPKAAVADESLEMADGVVTMDFVGDIMLGRNIKKYAEAKGAEIIYGNIAPYWEQSDLTFANLECAVLENDVSEYDEPDAKYNSLYTDYEMLKDAMDAGIDVWACANNHMMDYGEKAALELNSWFQQNQVNYSGLLEKKEEAASAINIIEQNGVKIAFLSITEKYGLSGRNILTTSTMYNQLIYEASNEADLTVVYMHWGQDSSIKANEKQEILGRQLIDAGADIVIGTHPHVLQNIEIYKNGVIFYSLGNFIFDEGETYSKDSVMVRYYLKANGEASFKLIPIRIEDGAPYVTTNSYYIERINNRLVDGMDKNAYEYDENGYVQITAPVISFD